MIECSEFEIISPARLQSVDVNWLLCFICQTNNGENLINPTENLIAIEYAILLINTALL